MRIRTELRRHPRADVLEVRGEFDTRLEAELDVLQELVVEALEGDDATRYQEWTNTGRPVRIVVIQPSHR